MKAPPGITFVITVNEVDRWGHHFERIASSSRDKRAIQDINVRLRALYLALTKKHNAD